jgi:hypothetical protein
MLKTIQSSSQREDRVRATWHQPKHMTCGGMRHRRAKKCGPANACFNSKLGSRIRIAVTIAIIDYLRTLLTARISRYVSERQYN